MIEFSPFYHVVCKRIAISELFFCYPPKSCMIDYAPAAERLEAERAAADRVAALATKGLAARLSAVGAHGSAWALNRSAAAARTAREVSGA